MRYQPSSMLFMVSTSSGLPLHLCLPRAHLHRQISWFPFNCPAYIDSWAKTGSCRKPNFVLFSLAPPIAMLSGIMVTITKRYRSQLWMGCWVIVIIGLALLGSTHADTSLATVIGFEILTGAGFGVVFATSYFPILAPLPLTSVAQALSFFAFFRQFTRVNIYMTVFTLRALLNVIRF